MQLLKITLLLIIVFTSINTSNASDSVITTPDTTYSKVIDLSYIVKSNTRGIGLALSGGGAQGLAQIGVLKILDEYNIPISHIAGTSIGAVVGGLYASGYSAEDLEKLALNTDWGGLFSNSPNRLKLFFTQRQEREKHLIEIRFDGLKPHIPQALTAGQKISDFLYRATVGSGYEAGADFNRLKIPFRAVSTDLISGQKVILSNGDLAEAIRASVAVPLAFSAVDYGDKLLVDGGLVCPVPIDEVYNMGASKVIAVNTTAHLYPKNKLKTPLDIVNQATTIMVKDKTEEELQKADLVIEPNLRAFENTGFSDVAGIIKAGETKTREMIPEIRKLLNSERLSNTKNNNSATEYIRATDNIAPRIKIKSIMFTGNTVFSSDILNNYLPVKIGKPLEKDSIRCGIDRIENLYRSSHYPLISISEISLDTESGELSIGINEGIISDMKIIGNKHTKSWVIERDFPKVKGKPYNSSDIYKGVNNLYNSGLFDRVTTDIIHRDDGSYILQLKMKEKLAWAMRFGIRYNDEYNLQGLAEFGDYNLWGIGNEFFVRGKIGDRENNIRAEFKADRIFKTLLTYSLYADYGRIEKDIFAVHRPNGAYMEKHSGAGFRLGQQISKLGMASIKLRIEDIKDEFPDGTSDLAKIRSIVLNSVVDTKDKQTFPDRGKYHKSYIEWANEILGGNEVYSKFYISLESYYRLPFGLNFHPRGALGFSINGLPLSEKFRLAEKPYGFSGFYTEELCGDNFFSYFLKLRKRFGKNVYSYIRYDAGDIFSDRKDVKFTNLKHSFRFGIAFSTILGPLDISYGIYEKRIDKFYLSWGYNF